jgi:hypothetical protein
MFCEIVFYENDLHGFHIFCQYSARLGRCNSILAGNMFVELSFIEPFDMANTRQLAVISDGRNKGEGMGRHHGFARSLDMRMTAQATFCASLSLK